MTTAQPGIDTETEQRRQQQHHADQRTATKLLLAEEIPAEALHSGDNKISVPPLVGALLKNEQDISLFEKLVFMNQRNR